MLLDETTSDKQSSGDDNGETCSSSSTEVQGTLNLTQFADLSTIYINIQLRFIVKLFDYFLQREILDKM